METNRSVLDGFVENLAQPLPNPGGGSAAAHGALVGTALLEKIARIERGRNREPASASLWQELLDEVRKITADLLNLRELDGLAYARFVAARQGEPDELALAIGEAIEVPARIMRTSSRALETARKIGLSCARHLLADVQVSCELLTGAMEGSYHIAAANVRLMAPGPPRIAQSERLTAEREECRLSGERAKAELHKRGEGREHLA